jgi:hypothetical protein
MRPFRIPSLWAMVLTLLGACYSQNVKAQNFHPASASEILDTLDVTPVDPPKQKAQEIEIENRSPWDIPSTSKNSHGLRYGGMMYREDSFKTDLILGLSQTWYLSRGWDFLVAGDYAYPTGPQLEVQVMRVLSRSLLKPTAHVGFTLLPKAKNGLAFLVDPDSAHFTAGLAMQDELKKGRAIKFEASGMAGFGGEPKFRFLIYALKVY